MKYPNVAAPQALRPPKSQHSNASLSPRRSSVTIGGRACRRSALYMRHKLFDVYAGSSTTASSCRRHLILTERQDRQQTGYKFCGMLPTSH